MALTEHEKNLEALSKDKTMPEYQMWLGPERPGVRTDTLSPQERAVASAIANQLGLKDPTDPSEKLSQNLDVASKKQWDEIVKAAAAQFNAATEPATTTKTADATTQNPYEQLANQVASMYLQQIGQLEPLISGESLFGPSGQTAQTVNAAAAAVPGASGFLQQAESQEAKDSAPLQAAMKGVGEATAQTAIPLGEAMAETGPAAMNYLESAPYASILSTLASEVPYKLASSTANTSFPQIFSNSPAWLAGVLNNLGINPTSTAGLSAPTTGATKTTNANSQPTTTTQPQGGSGGSQNPSTPGA